MSSSEMTFKQVEALIEELKIILPTVENLLNTAATAKENNFQAAQNLRKLEKTIQKFDEILVDAVATGIESKIEKLKEFDELERQLNKNIQIVKTAIEKIKPTQRLNSFLIFIIGALVGAITLFSIGGIQ